MILVITATDYLFTLLTFYRGIYISLMILSLTSGRSMQMHFIDPLSDHER